MGRTGAPNRALQEAILIGDYIAEELGIPRDQLCSHIGVFLKELNVQPNNPRGHAFRSIAGEVLATYGDPDLTTKRRSTRTIYFVESVFVPAPITPGSI
jgi:hypothetical protein